MPGDEGLAGAGRPVEDDLAAFDQKVPDSVQPVWSTKIGRPSQRGSGRRRSLGLRAAELPSSAAGSRSSEQLEPCRQRLDGSRSEREVDDGAARRELGWKRCGQVGEVDRGVGVAPFDGPAQVAAPAVGFRHVQSPVTSPMKTCSSLVATIEVAGDILVVKATISSTLALSSWCIRWS